MFLRSNLKKSITALVLLVSLFTIHYSLFTFQWAFGAERIAPSGAKVSPVPADGDNCLECHLLKQRLTVTQLFEEKASNFISAKAYLSTAHAKLACTQCHKGYVKAVERNTVSRYGRPKIITRHSEAEYRTYAQVATEACGDPGCHPKEKRDYILGSHSRKIAETTLELPTCTTCHNFHYIPYLQNRVMFGRKVIKKPISADTKLQFATMVCGGCHPQELDSFTGNYHYKALRLGNANAPMCYDCHGGHRSNPLRAGTAEAVVACMKCHKETSRQFTKYVIHLNPISRGAPPEILYTNLFYLALTILILSMSTLHTLILWQRKRREKRMKKE